MEWMILPLKRYAQFSGRAQRKEFWMWVLFLIVVTVVLSILDGVLGLTPRPPVAPEQLGVMPNAAHFGGFRGAGLLTGVFSLAVFLPNLAVQIRRLHDINRRGWWLLLPVLPYAVGFGIVIAGSLSAFSQKQPVSIGLMGIGGLFMIAGLACVILLLVWFCLDGTRGPNRFGEDPKRQDLGDVFR